jgi:L-lactate dehydrogenase complex protein LldG
MLTEEARPGFFAKLKNRFSSSASRQALVEDAANDVAVIRSAEVAEVTEQTVYTERPSMVTGESITEKEISLRTVQVSAPSYAPSTEKDLDIRFATNFINAGGKFIFCENLKDAVDNLRMLKAENNWGHIFCWENEIKDAFCNFNFQKNAVGFTIDNSDAAISLCELLVADDGTIILNPKQASRRRLPCFPKAHIILVDTSHLTASENEGIEKFTQMHKGELPSIIKLGSCNNGHFYDKQRLILNAEGPEDVYVLLVDEVIPPSLRP